MRVPVLAVFAKQMRALRTISDPFTTTIGIDGIVLAAAGSWWTLRCWSRWPRWSVGSCFYTTERAAEGNRRRPSPGGRGGLSDLAALSALGAQRVKGGCLDLFPAASWMAARLGRIGT
jgi:hypothetical protein